jgi:serine/threonine protein kinase
MSGIPDPLAAALADRYRLERPIGRGGMATVYLAEDLRHRRDVAVKVLESELAASLGSARFLTEIEIAAGLTHPHIVPLHDSGEADSFLYYVMPFIQGGSLRTLLSRHGTISIDEALPVARPVADALTYAHRRGIVHRDIKPENILFAEGHPMVADFGIARAVHTAGGARLTRTGFGLGTPGYMSPEQAAGVRELDARSDVFSLACVIYEMLIGDTPGLWVTEDAARLGRFMDALPDHRERLDRLSGSVEQALVRALALRSADRFETPSAFVDSLAVARNRRERYGTDEMRQIIGRAAELEAARDTEDGVFSVGGVERVAAEAGIPPAEVRAAARDIQRSGPRPLPELPSKWTWLSGRRTKIIIDRTIPGEVPVREFPYLVEEIRIALGTVGLVGTLGSSLTWSTSPPGQGTGRNVQITVSARDGQTRLRIEEQMANMAGGLYGGMVGGGGGGMGIAWVAIAAENLNNPLVGIATAVVWIAGAYGLARTIFVSTYDKRRRELVGLADRMEEHMVSAVAGRAIPGGRPDPQYPTGE